MTKTSDPPPPKRPPGSAAGLPHRPTSVAASLMNFAGQAPRPPAEPSVTRPSMDDALSRGSDAGKLAAALKLREMRERELVAAQLAAGDKPDSVANQLNLARALRDVGRQEEALAAYRRAVELDPDAPAAKHFLAIMGDEATPAATPPEMVAKLFDQYAEKFDQSLVADLKYQGPWLIEEAVRAARADADPGRKLEILDLGCGTGLAATTLLPIASAIDGVDISRNMIERARARGIYRRLAVADLMVVLRHHIAAYDLLVAADVFTYIGDLAPVFAAAYATLRAGGMFAFTTELGEGEGYLVSAGGHYRHAPRYVAATASAAGFMPRVENEGHLRMHLGAPVPCMTYVVAKP